MLEKLFPTLQTSISIPEPLIRNSTITISYLDADYKYLDLNAASAYLHGFKSREHALESESIFMLNDMVNFIEQLQQQTSEVIQNHQPMTLLNILPSFSDNRKTVQLVRKLPLSLPNSNVKGIVGYGNFIENSDFNDFLKQLMQLDVQHCTNIHQGKRSYTVGHFKQANLSKQEKTCLFFVIRGQSAQQIANQMNLSKRTVESYLDHVKVKLNCYTRSEMIEKAIDLGYVHIIPHTIFETYGSFIIGR